MLLFYRYTSDHHTDLLRIWHNLLIVIGIFWFLSDVIIAGFGCYYIGLCDLNAHILIKAYNIHIKHFILTHQYWALGINLAIWIIFVGLFLASVCSVRLIGIRAILMLKGERLSTIFRLIGVIIRVILICLSYPAAIFILLASPKYLIPAIGFFTDKRAMLEPLSVIGGIYTIFFALMLYSLIKTARKNSIIPR